MLRHGADPNHQHETAGTPLRLAVELQEGGGVFAAGGEVGGQRKIQSEDMTAVPLVKMLLAHGADPHVEDDCGVSAWRQACLMKNDAIADLLKPLS